MKCELSLVAPEGLRETAEASDGGLPLRFVLLKVVNELGRDRKDALLIPPEHVDLL